MTDLSAQLTQLNRLLHQGHAKAVVERAHLLLERHPNNVDVLHLLGLGYLQQEQLSEAERYLARAQAAAPDSPHLLNELGIVRLKQEAYGQAIGFFSRALQVDARHTDALNNIATAFIILRQPDKARAPLEQLLRLDPFSAQAHVKAAENCLALNDIEQAVRHGRKAVRLAPHLAPARLSLAEALEARGQFKQAKYQYLCVLAREPGQPGALSKLLAMKGTHVLERHAMQAERALDLGGLKEPDRAQLHLGLARYFDNRKQYDRAFEHLRTGNTIKFRNHPFESGRFSAAVDRIIQVFSPEFLRSLPAHEPHTTKPVFIVGMPRSGTTLVEQILASHSAIEAGGELSTITNIAASMAAQTAQSGVTYPEKMRELDGGALAIMAQRYLDRLNTISPHAARVTDKMPFNFMHLGLIVALFPGARIVHCSRNALDTCLSCYFTTFSEHLQFASDLDAVGRYYLDYRRLMEHWRRALPSQMLELEYEQLVENTEVSVRSLLAYCNVEWEPACMEFHRTERGVRTPSRWQVRQPIYGSAVGRWRKYERHLESLQKLLAPGLEQR